MRSSSSAATTPDVASPAELSVNARIAVNLGAPVVLAVRAKDRTAEQVVPRRRGVPGRTERPACPYRGGDRQPLRANAIDGDRRGAADIGSRRRPMPCPTSRCWWRRRSPICRPRSTATLLSGDTALMSREVMGVVVAGMTADHVLERLGEAVAVVTPGDRSDVVLAVASAHAAEGFPSLSCIILNGGFELHRSIAALVAGLRLRLPIIATTLGTFDDRQRGGVGPRPGHRDRRSAKSTPRCS